MTLPIPKQYAILVVASIVVGIANIAIASPTPKPAAFASSLATSKVDPFARAASEVKPGSSATATDYGTPSPQMVKAYQTMETNLFDEWSYREHHVQAIFDYQYWASWIILAVVLAIVCSGIVLSLVQARIAFAAMKSKNTPVVAVTATASTAPSSEARGWEKLLDTTLKFGNVEVTSSVLGTITLALSALFLYLYLQAVYPVTGGPQPVPTASSPATMP